MSDLLSRARDAEDLDCPCRDCGPICQGKLIRELADEIERLRAENERLRDQHDTYVEMVEQLTRQLDAAAVLLRRPDRVEWGYDAEENALAYFLDGKFAGPTIRHAIRMVAKEG